MSQFGDIFRQISRLRRRQRLAQRLRRASGRPAVAWQFRNASIAVGACMFLVLAAQLFQAYARGHDRASLVQAQLVEELAHSLAAEGARFHVAAVDLINEANVGSDAAERQREMRTAANQLREKFDRILALAPDASPVQRSASHVAKVNDVIRPIMTIDKNISLEKREIRENKIETTIVHMENSIQSMGSWASVQRSAYYAQMERSDKLAELVVIVATAIAFGVGFYFYHLLVRGVFPVANHLSRAIVAMANGRLDRPLPDQYYGEPHLMTLALRKLRAAARREQQYARIDFLTDLPNRRALAQALVDWPVGRTGSILIADIDGFKMINDGFGHPVGDELIRQIGSRLVDVSPAGAMVARLGGDEFAVLVPFGLSAPTDALADRIVSACSVPIEALGARLSVSVSVGVAPVSSIDGTRLELAEVLRPADLALYAAKANGRNGYALYSPDMCVSADLAHLIESDLDAAIGCGELHLAFQPIIDLHGNADEVEALVRWTHPTLGPVSPEQLIDVAERSGQMQRLGHWIIDTALDALTTWPTLTISLNLSPRQLRAPNFAATLTEQCRARGITPRRIILEITESVAVDDVDRATLMLSLLQTIGFRIALDDFGKGYSSLWILKQFAFDRIKIDRSLIEDINLSAPARAVLEAAVTMGRRLDMEVVAEGIESAQMVSDLTDIGCTHLQGFWFSCPLDQDAVATYYAEPLTPMRIAS